MTRAGVLEPAWVKFEGGMGWALSQAEKLGFRIRVHIAEEKEFRLKALIANIQHLGFQTTNFSCAWVSGLGSRIHYACVGEGGQGIEDLGWGSGIDDPTSRHLLA